MSAVAVEQLTHRYGERTALEALTLSVPRGAFFALLGPNGGGKTTLFRILSTLLRPASGKVTVMGHDVAARPDAVRREIGVVFQAPALDKRLTVLENLLGQGRLHGMSGTSLREEARRWLRDVGLSDREGSRVIELSGGLQRRLDIARALLPRPKLLLLDEPTTGLDPLARREMWEIVRRLRHESGITVLTTTHFLDEAETADRLALLDRGRLVADGAPAELKALLGGDVVAVRGPRPDTLCGRIAADFGVPAKLVDGEIRIESGSAGELVARLVSQFRDDIDSVTVGKPTLEDLFIAKTGRRLGGSEVRA